MDAYSQLKPAWHQDRIADLRAGRTPMPVHVQIILSDLCNQDCHFCAYRMSGGLSTELFADGDARNPNRKIPTDKALEIVDDCAAIGVKAIQFTGGGEPTVHRDHLEIFARAQSHGIDTALVTNGVKLDPTAPAILGMQWIRVSVDAGTAETYATIRGVSAQHWHKAWSNIRELAKNYRGTLGVGFVVTPENYREVLFAAYEAKDAGASNLRVGAVFSAEGASFYGDLIEPITEHIAAAKAATDGDGFEVVDLFGRRIGDLDHGRPTEAFCGYQHFTLYIGGDLSLYRCCNTAYTKAGLVGSLRDSRLRDMPMAYAPFDARTCRYCQFLGQNKAINALVKEPLHANFV